MYALRAKEKKPQIYSSTTITSTLSRILEKAHSIGSNGNTDDPRQTIMNKSGSIKNPLPLCDMQKANIMSALAEFIDDQKMSFNSVYTSAFQNFCRSLNIDYKIPSLFTLFRAISNKYEAMRLKRFSSLENIPGYIYLTLTDGLPVSLEVIL